VNGELSLLARYSFTALVQKKYLTAVRFETILTPDKVLNVLVYRSLHFDEIQYVGEHT